jgi:hypothetical protein
MVRKANINKSRIKGVRHIHDVDKNRVQAEVRMVNYDGEVQTELIDRALLLKGERELQAYFATRPLTVDKTDLAKLRAAHKLDESNTERVASRPGWRPSGKAFAWPERPIQEKNRTLGFHYEPGSLLEANSVSRGDLDEWLTVVCPAVAKSSYAIFAQGVVFAGPLLPFSCAPEGALFSFTGESGAGKSGICVAAQAIMGDPDPMLIPSWDLTLAGFTDLISEVRHFTFIIDDTSRDERTEKQRLELTSLVGHQLGGGGRRRLAKAYEKAQGAAPVRSPAFGLTSSEISPDELAALTGGAVLGGARVRFIPVPVPLPSKGGVFDKAVAGLKGRKVLRAGRRAAKEQEKVVRHCHGVAFRPYLDHLTARRPDLDKVVQSVEAAFVRDQEKRGRAKTSSHLRIAEKFGLVLAALELAIEAGVVPYTRKQVRRAVKVCFRAAVRGQDSQRRFLAKKIRQLRAVLADPSQTPVMAIGPAPGNAAFRRLENGRHVTLMRQEMLAPRLDLDADGVKQLLKEMLRRKLIEPGINDPYKRPVAFSGRRSIQHLVFTDAMVPPAAAKEVPTAVKAPEKPPVRMVKNLAGEMVPAPPMTSSRRRRRPRKTRWAGRPR